MTTRPQKVSASESDLPTREQVAAYVQLEPMLAAVHREMSELSKKKQDGVLNELKIRNINRLLDGLDVILSGRSAYAFLERLDAETIPQNSDAVLLLSQWQAALSQFKDQYFKLEPGTRQYKWFTADDPE